MFPQTIGKNGKTRTGRHLHPRDYSEYTIRRWTPSPELRWAVSEVALLELAEDAVLEQTRLWRLMPDPAAYLILHVWEYPEPQARWTLIGPRAVFRDIDRKGRRSTLIVRFRPGAASWFVPESLSDLTDGSTDPTAFGPEFRHGLAAVREAAGRGRWSASVEGLEQLLRRVCRPSWRQGSAALSAIGELSGRSGRMSMAELERSCGWSGRYLRQIIGEAAGIGPKRLARILRLRAAVRLAEEASRDEWAQVAVAAGYYDQSHLIADFRALVGEPPGRFLRRSRRE